MTLRIAINGFGRIGRNVLRALYTQGYRQDLQIVAINDLGDSSINAHLLKYDTVHGRAGQTITHDKEAKTLTIDGAGVWVIGGNSNRFKQDIRVDAGAGSTIGLESSALPNGGGAVIALANNARVRYEAGNTDDLSGKLSLAAGTTGKLDLGNNNVAFNSAFSSCAASACAQYRAR